MSTRDNRRFILLLTATIAPKGRQGHGLTRLDPGLRLGDYQTALRFWLGLDAPWLAGILFAENSGADLDSLRAIAANENPRSVPVEFRSYDQPPPPEGMHYGYSEFILTRQALKDSALAASAPYFIKATGRYRFPDLGRLITRLPRDFRVAVDCKLSKILTRDRHYLTHYALALFERAFFLEKLGDLPEQMTPAPPWTRAQFIETVLFDRLHPMRREPGIILRWPCNCEAEGIGGNGDDYATRSRRRKAAVRAVARRLMPWLWL